MRALRAEIELDGRSLGTLLADALVVATSIGSSAYSMSAGGPLLIGGIGVAQAVRAWLAGRLDAIAVLRAIGARPWELFALYLGQTAALGFVGSVVGAVLGSWIATVTTSP